ncbi:hypothetical protein AMK59_1777, partial [Oryctes borbonicus]
MSSKTTYRKNIELSTVKALFSPDRIQGRMDWFMYRDIRYVDEKEPLKYFWKHAHVSEDISRFDLLVESMMSCSLPIVPVIQPLSTLNSQADFPIHIGIKV